MEITELCKLAYKYGSDKCPQIKHTYTIVYDKMFKDKRNDIKKVLEVGVGTAESMAHSRFYRIGASLYMWRDYFPNAKIYGIDIAPESIFLADRIETFLCDETNPEHLKRLIDNIGSDIDLFVDDGSHAKEHQVFLAKTMMPLLKKDVIYIIEDVEFPQFITSQLSEYFCYVPRLPYILYKIGKFKNKIPKDRLLIVQNK